MSAVPAARTPGRGRGLTELRHAAANFRHDPGDLGFEASNGLFQFHLVTGLVGGAGAVLGGSGFKAAGGLTSLTQ